MYWKLKGCGIESQGTHTDNFYILNALKSYSKCVNINEASCTTVSYSKIM